MAYALNFAPHIGLTSPADGLFLSSAGLDPIDQIKFAADHGFCAIEDNFLQLRERHVQHAIGRTLASLRMTMGCFLGTLTHQRPTFSLADESVRTLLISELRSAIETARRVSGHHLTMLLGRRLGNVPLETQMTAATDNLLFLAEIAESAGVQLLIEGISTRRWPDVLVTNPIQAYDLCNKVQSNAVQVLFDVYQCGQEGRDILADMKTCWEKIGCIQIADSPGRCEPGTGAIDFPPILSYLAERKWRGLVEMEHAAADPSAAGEQSIIRLYETLSRQTAEGAS